ncbi:MAG: hypothetical protein JWO67_6763, partial [Streptosporangiaceae bacterium]|nr:hypothetical protein [Streptosporangiaceae bacterium]
AQLTRSAVTCVVLLPSNYWRAAEVITAVEARGLPEATELREAYQELCASCCDDGPSSRDP